MLKKVLIISGLLFSLSQIWAQGVNIDFESSSAGTYTAGNSVSGWSLTSQTATNCGPGAWVSGSPEFSLVNTPIVSFPVIGFIPQSPLGGNVVAALNNQTANSSVTKLSQVISVTNNNYSMQFAYAGVWQNHTTALCCENTGFQLVLKDQNGTLLSCHSLTVNTDHVCGTAGVTTSVMTTGSGFVAWTNWQIRFIDLTPYINSNITIEIISKDCIYGDHYGTLLCDLKFGLLFPSLFNLFGFTSFDPYFGPKFCSGSSIAQISAPLGYATYSWTGPSIIPPSQSTLATITLTNQPLGSLYTVTMMTFNGCMFTKTYTLNTTAVSIAGIVSNSTCIMGSSGSATVVGTGSGTGYNYTWFNSNGTVIGTNSVVNYLAAGVYTVNITSSGSASNTCGSDTKTIAISTAPTNTFLIPKTFCGNEAILCSPIQGNTYQWYNSSGVAISSSLSGTSSCYTVTNASNGNHFWLGISSNYGCRDSLDFILFAVNPGTLAALTTPIACPNGTNGSIVLSMTPSAGAPTGLNSFLVTNSNSSTPGYSVISSPGVSNTFTANGLSASGSYSVSAFDGACHYNLSFSVTPYVFSVSLSGSSSNTICSYSNLGINANISPYHLPGQYSYSWTPYLNFFAGINTHSNVLIMTSSLSPGTNTTITYSVVVSPTNMNCPQTKTVNVTFANPALPVISPIPALCSNQSAYTITSSPAGIFSNNAAVSSNGIITPSLATSGINNFTISNSIGTCVAQSSGSFIINPIPTLQISGNTNICEGQATSLLAQGAGIYSWNGMATGPVYTGSPASDTTYYVTGGNAFGCYTTVFVPINVTPLPVLLVLGDSTICEGESTILYASGADSYNWNGTAGSSSISVSPTVSTTYTITGFNNPGSCASTNAITVNVIDCVDTGLEDLFTQAGIKVYPNPSNGNLFIESNESNEIVLSDLSGKIIYSHKIDAGRHALDLSTLADGYYLLKIKNSKASKSYKILKNN